MPALESMQLKLLWSCKAKRITLLCSEVCNNNFRNAKHTGLISLLFTSQRLQYSVLFPFFANQITRGTRHQALILSRSLLFAFVVLCSPIYFRVHFEWEFNSRRLVRLLIKSFVPAARPLSTVHCIYYAQQRQRLAHRWVEPACLSACLPGTKFMGTSRCLWAHFGAIIHADRLGALAALATEMLRCLQAAD